MPPNSKILLWNKQKNIPEAIDAVDARSLLDAGSHFEYTEGQTTVGGSSVPLTSGRNQPLDRVVLGEGATNTIESQVAEQSALTKEEEFGGARDQIQTFGEGILSGMTLGLLEEPGLIADARREQNAGTATAGQLLGIIGTMGVGATPVGALGELAEASRAATAARLGGGRGAQVLAGAAEGALFGAVDEGIHQAFDVVIRDKEFVAERLVSAAGVGAILGGGLEGIKAAASAVKSSKPTVKGVKSAVIPKEMEDSFASTLDEARRSIDNSVSENVSRLRVLEAFQDDVVNNIPGVADIPEGQLLKDISPDWFKERYEAIDAVNAAQRKLAKASEGKLLDQNKRGFRRWAEAWSEYEQAANDLDSLLREPPTLRAPVEAVAAAVVNLPKSRFDVDNVMAAFKKKPNAADIPAYEEAARLLKVEADKLREAAEIAGDQLGFRQAGDARRLSEKFAEDLATFRQRNVPIEPPAPSGVAAGTPNGNATSAGNKRAKQKQPTPKPGKPPLNPEGTSYINIFDALDGGDEALANLMGRMNGNVPIYKDTYSAKTPILRQFLNDWGIDSALRPALSPRTDAQRSIYAEINKSLMSSAEKLQELNPTAGGIPGVVSRFGADGLVGRSTFIDSVIDVWSNHQYGRMVAGLAANKNAKLTRSVMDKYGWSNRDNLPEALAGLAEAAARDQRQGVQALNAGLTNFTPLNTIAFTASRLGKLANWARESKDRAVTAIENLLTRKRISVATRLGTALKVSYTGNPEDETADPLVKVQQLRELVSSPDAVRQRARTAVDGVFKVSPELAMQMEDAQVRKIMNLAARAPAYIMTPGLVPDRPYGAEWDFFSDYERATHDPDSIVDAVTSGRLNQAIAEASREQHPAQHKVLTEALVRGLTDEKLRNMSPHALEQAELLLGYPLRPTVGIQQQEVYARMKNQAQVVPGGQPNPRGVPKPTMSQQQAAPPPQR